MDKFLIHTPEIDDESGDEYAWSKAIGRIKDKKRQWKEIEDLISSKTSTKNSNQFIQNVLDGLIEIKTEHFLDKEHVKYGKKKNF